MAKIMKNSLNQLISGIARKRAVNHISHVLDFNNSLCRFVKSRADFNIGNISSVVPTGSNVEDVSDFSWGFGKGSDRSLPYRILETLRSNTNAVAVFDDVMGEKQNAEDQGSCITTNSEVYHLTTSADASQLTLNSLVNETGVSWHFLCVVFENDATVNIKDAISGSRFELFKNILEVVVGAYDGEGYIHWSPNTEAHL